MTGSRCFRARVRNCPLPASGSATIHLPPGSIGRGGMTGGSNGSTTIPDRAARTCRRSDTRKGGRTRRRRSRRDECRRHTGRTGGIRAGGDACRPPAGPPAPASRAQALAERAPSRRFPPPTAATPAALARSLPALPAAWPVVSPLLARACLDVADLCARGSGSGRGLDPSSGKAASSFPRDFSASFLPRMERFGPFTLSMRGAAAPFERGNTI